MLEAYLLKATLSSISILPSSRHHLQLTWGPLSLISRRHLQLTWGPHCPQFILPSSTAYLRAKLSSISRLTSSAAYLRTTLSSISRLPSSTAYLWATLSSISRLHSSTAYLRATLSSISRLPSSTAYLRATSSSISRLTSSTAASPFFLSPATSTSTKIKTTISYTGILNIGVLVNIPLAHYSVEKFNVQ